jgi:hypothetical protein
MESKNKKLYFQIILFAITFIVAFFGTQYLIKHFKSGDSELKKTADDINKSCPVMIDQETRLDHVAFLNDTVFQYNYTLVNIAKEDANFDLEKMKQFVESQSQKNLDNNAAMKYQRENHVSLMYQYKDKNNKDLFNFTIRSKNKN